MTVEIRDALTFGLSTTLQPTEPTSQLTGGLAYSPDGRSVACSSDTAIIIWDIQTGGVVKEIQRSTGPTDPPVWSLDGRSISTMRRNFASDPTIHTYDVASGTALPPIAVRSHDKPHLWAHDKYFRVMRTIKNGGIRTIDIFEVRPVLTRTDSFSIQLDTGPSIKLFSPVTYRVSATGFYNAAHKIDLTIFDLRTSKKILPACGNWGASFALSSDGSLFIGSGGSGFLIWKYDTGRYIKWREYPVPAYPVFHYLSSPNLQSILGHSGDILRLWRLDGPSIAPTALPQQLGTFSCCGTYMATTHRGSCTITITDILSRNTSFFIDTDIKVFELGFTGNVLLVVGSGAVVAWLSTEWGLVDGTFGNRRAGRGGSVWTVSISQSCAWDPIFSVEGEHAVIKSDGDTPHIYNTRTGEVLELAQAPLHLGGPWYPLVDIKQARNHFYEGSARNAPTEDDWGPSRTCFKEGWVKDHQGKHLLWLPSEWRVGEGHRVQWFSDTAIMRFLLCGEPVTIKLY